MEVDVKFRRRLFRMFVILLIVVLGFTWVLHGIVSSRYAAHMVDESRELLRKALRMSSNTKMLVQARQAEEMLRSSRLDDVGDLKRVCEKVGADALSIVGTDGRIYLSTVPEYIGFDCAAHEQSKPFLCLLNGAKDFAQDFGPTGYDPNRHSKFVGVALGRGGFLQLEFVEDRYITVPQLAFSRTLSMVEAGALVAMMFVGFFSLVRVFRGQFVAEAAKLMSGDLAAAKTVQTAMLPSTFPPYPSMVGTFDIYATMEPSVEVGGDFYDFFFVRSGLFALVIADVKAKGITAATCAFLVKTSLQRLLNEGLPVAEAIDEALRLLDGGTCAGMDVRVWAGTVDLRNGRLDYANRDQRNPVMFGEAGRELLEGSGTRTLRPGDRMFFYCDGLVSALNAESFAYGQRRMVESIRGDYAKEVVLNALKDVKAYIGDVRQQDDITLMAFRLNRYLV